MSWQIRVPRGESRGINGATTTTTTIGVHHWWEVIGKLRISVKVWKLRWRLEFELMGEPVVEGLYKRESAQNGRFSRNFLISDVLLHLTCHPWYSFDPITFLLRSNSAHLTPFESPLCLPSSKYNFIIIIIVGEFLFSLRAWWHYKLRKIESCYFDRWWKSILRYDVSY